MTRAARIWLDFASSGGSVLHEHTGDFVLGAEWALLASKSEDARRILGS